MVRDIPKNKAWFMRQLIVCESGWRACGCNIPNTEFYLPQNLDR